MQNPIENSRFKNLVDLGFNQKSATVMHLDLNSCFATIEQQANPHLRGRPIAVAAYASNNGCILAPSVEAKRFGVKTGMRVKDGKVLCPNLLVLPPDPDKYRNVHVKFRKLLRRYTDNVLPKSIDEFVLDLEGFPSLKSGIENIAQEIKDKIKKEIGDWLTISVGIAPNKYLAKIGAGLHKPDGLDVVDSQTFRGIYQNLKLTDLCGIKKANSKRLESMDIFSVEDFYNAPVWKLKAAFHSIAGYYWYLRLRGFEIDDVEYARRSYGNSYALPKPYTNPKDLAPILQKLCEKAGSRMRRAGYMARGVHLSITFRDWNGWHHGQTQNSLIFDSRDIYKTAFQILLSCPDIKPVRNLAVSCFNIEKPESHQTSFWEEYDKKRRLVRAVDQVNNRWGGFVITPARMAGTGGVVHDRIAFGGVKELEEIITS